MISNQQNIIEAVSQLRYFLSTAHLNWAANQTLKRFQLPNGETISCVYWKNTFYITGTDIVRSLVFRFQAYGRPVKNMKKFEEGIFSDLRNLKPGVDAILEEPRSEFLEMLYKNNCIRTQKKQKVFYWFSVPHDRLFLDALERDHKRESEGKEPSTVAIQSAPYIEAMAMNPKTKIPSNIKQYAASYNTLPQIQNNNNYYIESNNKPQLQQINTNVNVCQNKTVNMNYPVVQTQVMSQQTPVVQVVQQAVYPQQQVYGQVTPNTASPVYDNAQYVIAPSTTAVNGQMTPTMANNQIMTTNGQVITTNVQVVSPTPMNNVQPQVITYQQQQPQVITTQVSPISTYAQEGLGQSEIKSGEMIPNNQVIYSSQTSPSSAQSTPVILESEEIVFGEQDNKEEYIYACDVKGCGRRFKRPEFLRRHQRCHKSDSGYGNEMIQHKASVNKLKIQTPYVVKTQSPYTPQSVSYIQNNGIVTPVSSHTITQMPSPPTNDISYSNVIVKQEVNNIVKPISPNETTYYQGEVSPIVGNQSSPIIVTTTGNMYSGEVAVTSASNQTTESALFPTINVNVQTPTIVQSDSTSVCQMPSPPLQYQPNYTQVTYQTQPVYTTTTPIY